MNKKEYFETLRSHFERSLDRSLLSKQSSIQSSLQSAAVLPQPSYLPYPQAQYQYTPQPLANYGFTQQQSQLYASDPNLQKPPIFNPPSTETLQTYHGRKKKTVRFQVYNATNLQGIQDMRRAKEDSLTNFSRERSLSNSIRDKMNKDIQAKQQQQQQQQLNLSNLNQSANHSVVQSQRQQLEEELKENTFGVETLKKYVNLIVSTNTNKETEIEKAVDQTNPFSQRDQSSLLREDGPPAEQSDKQTSNLILSQLMRSNLSTALHKMDEERKSFQNSVVASKQNSRLVSPVYATSSTMHGKIHMNIDQMLKMSLSQQKPEEDSPTTHQQLKDHFTFSSLNIMFQGVSNLADIANSRLLIEAFDTLKSYSDITNDKIIRQQASSEIYLQKRTINLLKFALFKIKQHRQNLIRAQEFREYKLKKYKEGIFKKIRKILFIEKQWLLRVQKEFQLERKDYLWGQWKLYVKYSKARRARKLNLYYQFLLQLRLLADQTETLTQKIFNKLQKNKLARLFQLLKQNILIQKRKRRNRVKYLRHRAYKLQLEAFQYLKNNRKMQKTIKQDRFLSKALIKEEEFFTVEVCQRTGLSGLIQGIGKRNLNMTQHQAINVNIVN